MLGTGKKNKKNHKTLLILKVVTEHESNLRPLGLPPICSITELPVSEGLEQRPVSPVPEPSPLPRPRHTLPETTRIVDLNSK